MSPTCSPVLQTNSWTAACSCRVCCVALTTQSWCPTSVLSHSIEFIVPGWLIFGHSVLHGFSLPYSSSQAALLTSGTKPHYFKAPFPVIFQKELSVTLSRPSLNGVCSPFATLCCCNIAEVSLTIIFCVLLYHEDISSLAKAGPSLYCQKPPLFFLLFSHSHAAAVHECCLPPLCVEQGARGISTNLRLGDLHVVNRPSLLHLSPGKVKPDQMETLGMSQRGESIPLGLGDIGLCVLQSCCRAHRDTRSAASSWGRDPSGTSRCSLCLQNIPGITVTRVAAEMSLGTALHPCFNGRKTPVLVWPCADTGDATAVMDVMSELWLLL